MKRYIVGCMLAIIIVIGMSQLTHAESRVAPQIVGGVIVTPNELPWQALLYIGGYMCGGSLIDEEWVLTAAHCVEGMTAGQATVYLGLHDRQSLNATANPYLQTRAVSQIIAHASYNPSTTDYDVALLRLAIPVDLTTGVAPVTLATQPQHATLYNKDTMLTVSGWGTISSGGSTSRYLRKVNVPVVSNADCNTMYGGGITARMMCAGDTVNGGEDSCQGDSGGPIFVQQNGSFVQVGIVSWGTGCADKDYPGVYTNVYALYDWINNYVGLPGVATRTPTETMDPARTWTPTPSDTPSLTPEPSLTRTPRPRMSATITPSNTAVPTPSRTHTSTRTSTATSTATPLLGRSVALKASFANTHAFASQRSGAEGLVCTISGVACVTPLEGGVIGSAAQFTDTMRSRLWTVRSVSVSRTSGVFVGMWVKSSADAVLIKSIGAVPFQMEINAGVVRCGVNQRGTTHAVSGTTAVAHGDWVYLACVIYAGNPNTIQPFVNGLPDAAVDALPVAPSAGRWQVANTGSVVANVAMDELWIATGNVVANDVIQVFNLLAPVAVDRVPTFTATPSLTRTPTRTVRPTAPPPPSRTPTAVPAWALAMGNGDFESGRDGQWQESSSNYAHVIEEIAVVSPRSGRFLAWFGGSDEETTRLSQTVKVPVDAPYIRLYYQLKSAEECGMVWDSVDFAIDGSVLATIELCSKNASLKWKAYTLDVSAYKGDTVEFVIEATTDITIPSDFWVDDVGFVQTKDARSAPERIAPRIDRTARPTRQSK
jgi:trypsin